MSWLKTLIDKKLANLPKDAFVDRTFGFGDIGGVVQLVEKALQENAEKKTEANRASLMASARDPFPEGKNYPTFTSWAADFWQAEMKCPRVVRNALLIAIYSHTEYLLRSWCEQIASVPNGPPLKGKAKTESTVGWYLRYLREAGLELGDFTKWPEWEAMDAYRRARNCLAHNGGIVDDQQDAQKIAALPKIQVDESGLLERKPVVHLLPGACESAAETAKAFIGRAVSAVEHDAG
jgi:hypothetical protein